MLLLVVLSALLSPEVLALLLIFFLERQEPEGLARAGDWRGERLS